MSTKIWAAKICMSSGCSVVITSSNKKNPLVSINKKNSTWFYADKSPKRSRQQWLLNHLHPSGTVYIDHGAMLAIQNNKSLLPSGVTEVKGNFNRGDVISIVDNQKRKVAIGVIAYDSRDTKKIIGKNSKEITKILGYEGRDEIIHKDDLVKKNL